MNAKIEVMAKSVGAYILFWRYALQEGNLHTSNFKSEKMGLCN